MTQETLDDVIKPTSPHYHQAKDFLTDWLGEIKRQANTKRKLKGTGYSRTLRKWSIYYGDTELADIAQRAVLGMNWIRAKYNFDGK